ncbi:Crp/Fnr family transcriptional regulator [Listeria booriae]|uniref:Crp/Fnr family transcriptional regulator n=1 Tax=Listeria booriae TaxID=1552123 RepID=A0A7X0Z8D1_9LIST|nr:Crp/Fnr family transcriptional regulator [Listeria booriae]MBC1212283.1 Crp/Fnr family transcriptional regulator [Listeria booriae]MBC1228579.1 Crp/Fnr family transcriptional regulator [Listeria booriae]MBC1230839.1 Crp/Fnr family transcriptional regulator [Listeria booriae]MBC1273776.1 Crp/Fnr family transcriptional regulator [Listeria booriae]MBC1285510.1 Crp/Fnr family transcriptional regulator [Listeria booriae]
MSLKDLYSQDTIKREFNSKQLYSLLTNDDFFEIKQQTLMFSKNDKIPLRDYSKHYVYYILEGITCISIEEQIIDFRGIGEFVGLVDSTSVYGNEFYLKPLMDVTVQRFEKSEVMAKIMSIQDGYLYHYNCMLDCYDNYTNRIMLHEETDERRTLTTLIYIGENFGVKYENVHVIPRVFTRKLMAAYLGISRTKLSDILSRLRHTGVITVDRRRQISVYQQ